MGVCGPSSSQLDNSSTESLSMPLYERAVEARRRSGGAGRRQPQAPPARAWPCSWGWEIAHRIPISPTSRPAGQPPKRKSRLASGPRASPGAGAGRERTPAATDRPESALPSGQRAAVRPAAHPPGPPSRPGRNLDRRHTPRSPRQALVAPRRWGALAALARGSPSRRWHAWQRFSFQPFLRMRRDPVGDRALTKHRGSSEGA